MRGSIGSAWQLAPAFVAASFLGLAAQATMAQPAVPRPLLRQDDDVTTDNGNRTVDTMSVVRSMGGQSGYMVNLTLKPIAQKTESAIWGSIDAKTIPPQVLMLPFADHPTYQATQDASFGVASDSATFAQSVQLARHAELCPPASTTCSMPPAGFADSLWVGGVPMAFQGGARSTTRTWRAFRNVTMAGSGVPYWIADDFPNATPTDTRSSLLFYNSSVSSMQTVIAGGTTIAGMPASLTTTDSVQSFDVSTGGARYAAVVKMNSATTPVPAVLLGQTSTTKAPWLCGGNVVQAGFQLSGNHIRPQEAISQFRGVAVSEGDGPRKVTMASLSTTSSRGRGEVLFRDCTIVLRDGESIASTKLAGPFVGIKVNGRADYAVCVGLAERNQQALLINGQIVVRTGDRLWITEGDHPLAGTVRSFRAPDGLALSARSPDGTVKLYFIASMEPDLDPANSYESRIDVLYELEAVAGSPGICAVDWDGDGHLSIDDIFIFINAWFVSPIDFSGNGTADIDDIFIFLNAWFAGC